MARVAARAGSGAICLREEKPAVVGRAAGERARGQVAQEERRGAAGNREKCRRWAAGGAAEKQRGGSRRKKMRTCS
jgi:hypothetical protein